MDARRKSVILNTISSVATFGSQMLWNVAMGWLTRANIASNTIVLWSCLGPKFIKSGDDVPKDTKFEIVPSSNEESFREQSFEVLGVVPKFDWELAITKDSRIVPLYHELFTSDAEWIQVTEIEPDIYLGGIPEPADDFPGMQNMDSSKAPHSFVNELNIGLIVSFSDYNVMWNHKIEFIHYVIFDQVDMLISSCFKDVIQKMKQARNQGQKIFIHCHMGYSRSVTTLAAFYLVYGLPNNETPSLVDVIKFIQVKRPFIRPNVGFFAQLLELETELGRRIRNDKSESSTCSDEKIEICK